MLPPLFPQTALAVSPIVPVRAGAPETERWLAEGQKPGVGARKGAPGIRSLGGCILCALFLFPGECHREQNTTTRKHSLAVK